MLHHYKVLMCCISIKHGIFKKKQKFENVAQQLGFYPLQMSNIIDVQHVAQL